MPASQGRPRDRQDASAPRLPLLLDALVDSVVEGLREHLPGALGILLKSLAICLSAASAHLILGASMAATTFGAGAGIIATAVHGGLGFLRGHEPRQ
jgi:hypothetical protein